MLKLIILKHHPQTYLLGKVTEMDEEPGLLVEDVYAIDVDAELVPCLLYTSDAADE